MSVPSKDADPNLGPNEASYGVGKVEPIRGSPGEVGANVPGSHSDEARPPADPGSRPDECATRSAGALRTGANGPAASVFRQFGRPNPSWPDDALVEACLNGREEAWCGLIDKYRHLILSIPLRHGFSEDEANEIFQQVCLTLLSHLCSVREPRTLAAWLIRTTVHECWSWRRQTQRHAGVGLDHPAAVAAPGTEELPDHMVRELQREQLLREALLALRPRCRRLIQMLFFERPARAYAEVAGRLGVAKGSVGYIRMRCLRRLRLLLETNGFR